VQLTPQKAEATAPLPLLGLLGLPPYLDALASTVLTFRDAAGARWIRMPDGTLKEQERDTAHNSILAAFSQALPAAADPAEVAGPAEEDGGP
jgi:hypothetical protein